MRQAAAAVQQLVLAGLVRAETLLHTRGCADSGQGLAAKRVLPAKRGTMVAAPRQQPLALVQSTSCNSRQNQQPDAD